MKSTQRLHEIGQSLWLDNITRDLMTSGTLRGYIKAFSMIGSSAIEKKLVKGDPCFT